MTALELLYAYFSYIYLAWAVLWLEISKGKNLASANCATAMVVWTALLQILYVRGEIEVNATAACIVIFLSYLLWISRRNYGHWLPWFLIATYSGLLVFNSTYTPGGDYTLEEVIFYKEWRNMFFITAMIGIGLNWIPWMNTRRLSPE